MDFWLLPKWKLYFVTIWLLINEAAGIRHNGIYSVNCLHIACISENITVLGSHQSFYERILLRFLHDAFHLGVRQ